MDAETIYASWLAKEEETRQRDVILHRDYYDGVQGLKMTERQKEFIGFDKREQDWSLNYCRTVVDSVAERMIVSGFITGDDALKAWVGELWDAERMDEIQQIVHQGAVRDGEYFLIVDWDDDAGLSFIPHPRFTDSLWNGSGFGCKAHYQEDDPTQPMLFASKRWTETRIENGKRRTVQRMNLYYPDKIEKHEMAGSTDATWRLAEAQAWTDSNGEPLGIPVIHFRNPQTRSELWDAIAPQDVINKTALDIVAEADVSAFRILVARGFMPTTDGKDPASDASNYLKVAPGNWIGPVDPAHGVDIIEGTNLQPLMDALDAWIFKLAQVTDTPLSRFQATRQVASDETLKQQEGPLLAKIRQKQVLFGNAWENAIYMARRLSSVFGSEKLDEASLLETDWKPAETRDEIAEERAFWDTAKLAVESGVSLPAYLALQGWDDDRIATVTDDAEYQERRAMMGMALGAGE